MSSHQCPSCGGTDFEEVLDAFSQFCIACGWVEHNPSVLFRHDADFIPDLTGRDLSSVTAVKRSTGTILLRDEYGRARGMQGIDRTDEERRELTAQRHRRDVFRLIEGALRRLGYSGVYERAVTLFEQLRDAAQQRAARAKKIIGQDDVALPKSVTRLNKPIRWGRAADAMAAAAVYGSLHRENHDVSLQAVAEAAQQPLTSVKRAFYRLKALAGPRSFFVSLSARDRVTEITSQTADYFQFWETLVATHSQEATSGSPAMVEWLRTHARQPPRAQSLYTGGLFDRAQNIAQDIAKVLLSEARETMPTTALATYALALLALEGAARQPLPQKDFVTADVVHSALSFNPSDTPTSLPTDKTLGGPSHTIKMRYTEMKRCLSDWAVDLPWVRAQHSKRKSKAKASGADKEQTLTRTELALYTEDVIVLRKPLLAQREEKRTALGMEMALEEDQAGPSDAVYWKKAYSVPSIRDRETIQPVSPVVSREGAAVSNSSTLDAQDDALFDTNELESYLRRDDEMRALMLLKNRTGDWDGQIPRSNDFAPKRKGDVLTETVQEPPPIIKRPKLNPDALASALRPIRWQDQTTGEEDWEEDWDDEEGEADET